MTATYKIAAYYTERGKVKQINEDTTLAKVESESAREVVEHRSWDSDHETIPAPSSLLQK